MTEPAPITAALEEAGAELNRAVASLKRAAHALAVLEAADAIDNLQAALEQRGAQLVDAERRARIADELRAQAQESAELRRLELDQAKRELRALRSLEERRA